MTNGSLFVQLSSVSILYLNGTAPITAPIETYPALLDSTLPYLYLPNSTIDWMKARFHLTESPLRGVFYYNGSDIQAANNTARDIQGLSFGLGTYLNNGTRHSIFLPFSAFNTTLSWTYNLTTRNIVALPIRRSLTQYAILGRAFLQEAYVVADFDRGVFNVSQTTVNPSSESIVPIYSRYWTDGTGPAPSNSTQSSQNTAHGLSSGGIAGAVIGPLAAIVIILASLWYFRRRRRRLALEPSDEKDEYRKSELDASGIPIKEAMSNSVVELDSHFEGAQLDVPFQPRLPVELDAAPAAIQLADDPEERHHV